ncbi:predicted protein [Nematostella vectensis]|uniref:Short-chain dehydrogenase/reductase 3 n=2 Tax=Nematostella vectensis TaxID=45351 RepID=A7S4C5_NEMVE|nr:predicted protein [Nematostella vectensis]|eukprot:XP_001633559.1 predicted protein [Nematostella vectensis]
MWVVVDFIKLLFVVVYQVFQALAQFVFPRRKSLRGETVLITGAASGIGRLTALILAKKGCKLVLWDINLEALKAVAQEIQDLGAETHYFECDVRKKDEVEKVANAVEDQAGNVTILINNAGVVTGKKFLNCSESDVMRTFQVNSLAHIWTIQRFIPSMMEKNRGHIVSIASVAGYFGLVGCVDYCASKFAAVGLIEALRREIHGLGKMGIEFTTICPHFTATGMFAGVKLKYPNLPGLGELKPEFVAEKIVDGIETNSRTVFIPFMSRISYYLQTVIPTHSSDMLVRFLGGDEAMDTFVGRRQTKT